VRILGSVVLIGEIRYDTTNSFLGHVNLNFLECIMSEKIKKCKS